MSPPTAVQARPVTMPIWSAGPSQISRLRVLREVIHGSRAGLNLFAWRTRDLEIFPNSRSSWQPCSCVYSPMIFVRARLSSRGRSAPVRSPLSVSGSDGGGDRSFPRACNPKAGIVPSVAKAGWIVSSVAVVMNITFERSRSRPGSYRETRNSVQVEHQKFRWVAAKSAPTLSISSSIISGLLVPAC